MKKKLFFKSDDIKYLACPHYEGLSIKNILEFASKDARVPKYLPDDRDIDKVPRQWIVNICYTILGKPFADWVGESIAHRNQKVAEKQDLLLDLDPEILKAFHQSKNISTVSIK